MCLQGTWTDGQDDIPLIPPQTLFAGGIINLCQSRKICVYGNRSFADFPILKGNNSSSWRVYSTHRGLDRFHRPHDLWKRFKPLWFHHSKIYLLLCFIVNNTYAQVERNMLSQTKIVIWKPLILLIFQF